MAKKMQETLVLFPDLLAYTRKFTDEQFGILMRSLFAFRFAGEIYDGEDILVDMAFQMASEQIGRVIAFSEIQSQRAKGRHRTQNAAECSQSQPTGEEAQPSAAEASQSTPESAPILSNPILSNPILSSPIPSNPVPSCMDGADEPPTPTHGREPKHKYGEYRNVLLSDEEVDKLRRELPGWEAMVERLSEYIASSGKKYKSHYATLRAWARREPEQCKAPPAYYPEDDLTGIL